MGSPYVLQNAAPGLAPGGLLADGSAAAVAPLPARRRADRDPGQRPRLQQRRAGQSGPGVAGQPRAAPSRGRVGGGPPRRDLHGRSCRPGPVHHGTGGRGQRCDRLPGAGSTQHPAARCPGDAAEHEHPRAVSACLASDLVGSDRAAGILPAIAQANAFVQAAGDGWYRYHSLFAEVLRLRLRHEHPDLVAALHQRAARWYERNGQFADAVRHAALAADWPLAAGLFIDWLAISEVLEPRGACLWPASSGACRTPGPDGGCPVAGLRRARVVRWLAGLRRCGAGGRGRHPAGPARRSGDPGPAGRRADRPGRRPAQRGPHGHRAAAARAEQTVSALPAGQLNRNPGIRARVAYGRGVVELWAGQFDAAALCSARRSRRGPSGRRVRARRSPLLPRAGGGRARPAGQRRQAGRQRGSGPGARAAAGLPAAAHRCARRARLGARRAQRAGCGA